MLRWFKRCRVAATVVQAWWRGVLGVWAARRRVWHRLHALRARVQHGVLVAQAFARMVFVRRRYVHLRAATVFAQVRSVIRTGAATVFACGAGTGAAALCAARRHP